MTQYLDDKLPFQEEIYKKFHIKYPNITSLRSSGGIYIYKYDPYVNGPNLLITYDLYNEKFYFNYYWYSIDEFKRVLNLLSFV